MSLADKYTWSELASAFIAEGIICATAGAALHFAAPGWTDLWGGIAWVYVARTVLRVFRAG